MSNESIQNPRNKVGRYSGAGPAGVTEIVPTERERARGLEPMSLDSNRGWFGPGLAILAALGTGVGAFLIKRRRERQTLTSKIRRLGGLR